LAAERQRGAALHASSAAKSGSECLASSAHPLNRCSEDAKAIAGDSKKRKVPLSFAQQEKRPAPATNAVQDYKVHSEKEGTPVSLRKTFLSLRKGRDQAPFQSSGAALSMYYQNLYLPLFANIAEIQTLSLLTGSHHLRIHSAGS